MSSRGTEFVRFLGPSRGVPVPGTSDLITGLGNRGTSDLSAGGEWFLNSSRLGGFGEAEMTEERSLPSIASGLAGFQPL